MGGIGYSAGRGTLQTGSMNVEPPQGWYSDILLLQIRIRCGVVIGRDGGMIQSLKLPFWLGLGGNMADGKQPLPWIHIADICSLIKFCIEDKNAEGVYNGVAPQIVTNEDFTKVRVVAQSKQNLINFLLRRLQAFASVLRRPAVLHTPEFVVNLIFGKDRAALLTTGAKIQPKRVMESNFQYRYPNIVDACREVC